MDPGEALAQFIAVTDTDASTAASMLEATNYDLAQAIGLFFATKADEVAGGGGVPARSSALHEPPSTSGSTGLGRMQDWEEEVRAPIPVKRDRLYGDAYYTSRPNRGANLEKRTVDAFRDFEAEASGTASGASKAPVGLASLFEPPRDLILSRDLDNAKKAAADQSRWLLVNVQSNSEFASHQLNRDTWRDDTLQTIIRGSFIFWQGYESTEAGAEVVRSYALRALPAILVIDPLTNALVRQWHGFVEAHRLVEELVPFMDHSIDDPAAAQLSAIHHKRKLTEAAATGRPQAKDAKAALTEDQELELAVAMSMQNAAGADAQLQPAAPAGSRPPPSWMAATMSALQGTTATTDSLAGPGPFSNAARDPTGSSVGPGAKPGAAEMSNGAPPAMEAPAPAALPDEDLPPEPVPGAPGVCQVVVRLPDGRRAPRRFEIGAPVAVLYALCRSLVPEAADGRAFHLTEGYPGAHPSLGSAGHINTMAGAPALQNLEQTLGAGGFANGLLVMKWTP